ASGDAWIAWRSPIGAARRPCRKSRRGLRSHAPLPLRRPLRRRQYQRIAPLQDLLRVFGVDDFQTDQTAGTFADIDLVRPVDHVIDTLQQDLDGVPLRVVSN